MNPHVPVLRPLDADRVLSAQATLGSALELLVRRSDALLAFGEPGCFGAKSALELRFLQQLGEDPDSRLAELPASPLVFPDEDGARALLEADPRLPGAFVEVGDGLALLERPVPSVECAVIMAGGFGQRLRPLTDDTPKPLLEVGGRVLLFRILDSLAQHGVRRAWISIHHLGDRIREAVGDGSEWGLELDYLEETQPLGTGAGLSMLAASRDTNREPFFVVNGDLLTNVNFTALGRAHRLSGAAATMATHLYSTAFPYGVVRAEQGRLTGIEEKPVLRHSVNAGLYVFSAEVLDAIAPGEPLAMVDFLNDELIPRGAAATFPIVEYWNDVGTHDAFERAQREAADL